MANLCVKCQARYELIKAGVTVIETSGNPPQAFRIWNADLLGCPICGNQMITRFGNEPAVERHEPGFMKALMGVTREKRFVMHSPEALATRITHETVYVKARKQHGAN